MKTYVLILISILLFSCDEESKELTSQKVLSRNSEEAVVSTLRKKVPPDFETMHRILKTDTNVDIAHFSRNYPDNPYVVCYMQRHSITKVREKLSNYSSEDRERMKSVQLNLGKSLLYSINDYNFSIYIEGLNQELGLIDLSSKTSVQSMGNIRGGIFDSLKKAKSRVYGIETRVTRGRNIALRALEEDRSLYLTKKDYNNLSPEDRIPVVIDYISNLPQRLNLFLQENMQVNSTELISQDEMAKEILNFKVYIEDGLKECAGDKDAYIRLFLKYNKRMKARARYIKISYRNKITVNRVPEHESSVLILGLAHFRDYYTKTNDSKNDLYIEELLDHKKLNYILVKSK